MEMYGLDKDLELQNLAKGHHFYLARHSEVLPDLGRSYKTKIPWPFKMCSLHPTGRNDGSISRLLSLHGKYLEQKCSTLQKDR